MLQKLPLLTPENKAFWTGGKDAELLINFCENCDIFFHPPSPLCTACGSQKITPRPVSGKGKIVSFTVNYQPWTKDLEVPYVIAIIELEEGDDLRFVSNVINTDPETVFIDMRVEVYFKHVEDVWLPLFIPLKEKEGVKS